MSTEAQINADIDALREQISETPALYREACTILFFRYGITPTASKLYQYIRKGSMTAPADALAKFWADLREKSRVRIEHPDLPDELKTAAGDLVATLWTQAQAAAQESLATFRSEAQASLAEAREAIDTAEHDRTTALDAAAHARQSAEAAEERNLGLERALAAERAAKDSLSGQLEAASRQQLTLEAALADARRDFSSELEKLRQALQRSEERHEASEKRALLEIDRERTTAAALKKETEQLRRTLSETTERQRAELVRLQQERGEALQQLGTAEGALQEMRTTNRHQAELVQTLSAAAADHKAEYGLLQRDLVACQTRNAELELQMQKLREDQVAEPTIAPPPKRIRKKPSKE